MQVFDDCNLVARTRRGAEIELNDLALLRQFYLIDLVQSFDAALYLSGFGGVGLETIDEALFLGKRRLLARESGLLIRLANVALAFIEVVVTCVANDLAGIDLGDF